jgi:hypothetical protein
MGRFSPATTWRHLFNSELVAIDHLIVDRVLQDPAEQRDHRVDRRVESGRCRRLYVRPRLSVTVSMSDGSPAPSVRVPELSDRLRLIVQLIPEAIDEARPNLAKP